jgi:hypothetical protein
VEAPLSERSTSVRLNVGLLDDLLDDLSGTSLPPIFKELLYGWEATIHRIG